MGKQIHIFEVSNFEGSLCQKYLCWRNVLDNENRDMFVWLVIAAQKFALLKVLIRGSLNFISHPSSEQALGIVILNIWMGRIAYKARCNPK